MHVGRLQRKAMPILNTQEFAYVQILVIQVQIISGQIEDASEKRPTYIKENYANEKNCKGQNGLG